MSASAQDDDFTGFVTRGDARFFFIEGCEKCYWQLSTLDQGERAALRKAEEIYARDGANACLTFLELPW